jgi:dephospho-CoA kinase
MLTVALTGGIGSGKTAVAEHFAELGVPVIDADLLARELVRPGEPALAEIVEIFGADMLLPDGGLDRRKLRSRVFGDTVARQRLESVLHPRIRAEMQHRLAACDAPYAVLVVPLLLETGQLDLADRILVVDLPTELQLQRASLRDGQSRENIRSIMAAQVSREQRLAAADDVIDNSGTPQRLKQLANAMHQRYMSLSYNK